jgi:hypothetical protein
MAKIVIGSEIDSLIFNDKIQKSESYDLWI